MFSKTRASGLSLSISQFFRVSVCLSINKEYRLYVFLPPLPEVQCQNFLEIRNRWEKVLETSGLRLD